MKEKKYKLDEILKGINGEKLHNEILTGESVGREWPKDVSEVPSKEEYKKARERMEELLLITKDVSPDEDPLVAELDRASDIVYAYEEVHYPISDLTLTYRGYTGTVDWNDTDGLYYGQVKEIEPDLVPYEGKTLKKLEKDFKQALDLYLKREDKV